MNLNALHRRLMQDVLEIGNDLPRCSVLERQSPTAVPVIYKDELKVIRQVAGSTGVRVADRVSHEILGSTSSKHAGNLIESDNDTLQMAPIR
jgi:hypothetical protein